MRKFTCLCVLLTPFPTRTKRIDWVKEASDGVYSHWSSSGDIILQDASDPAYEQVLLNATDVKNSAGERIHFQDWKLSSDKRFVVLKADHRKLWRHSSYGNYYIHRFSDHKTFALRTPAIPAEVAYVEWSPTSHSLAYVYQNDLYIVTAATLDQLEDMDNVPEVIRVTSDGSETVFNGVPDWVYEEEVSLDRVSTILSFDSCILLILPNIGLQHQFRVVVESPERCHCLSSK